MRYIKTVAMESTTILKSKTIGFKMSIPMKPKKYYLNVPKSTLR